MSDDRPAAAHDFVDRLVMKALGTPDLPVPRLPSLYESPVAMAGFRHGETEAEERASEVDAASPLRKARRPVSTAQVRDTTPATLHASPATRAPLLQAVGTPALAPALAEDARSRRAAVDGEPAALQPVAHRAERGFDAALVAAEASRTARRRTRPDSDDAGPDAGTGRNGPVRPEAMAAVPRRHIDAATSQPKRGTQAASVAAAEPRDGVLVPRGRGLALPSIATRPHGLDRPSRTEGPGQGPGREVDVHVTIGRIDVRATPAAATGAKRPPSRGPQPLALDEYLGQRGAR